MAVKKHQVIGDILGRITDREDIEFSMDIVLLEEGAHVVANIQGLLALSLTDNMAEALALANSQEGLMKRLNLSPAEFAAIQTGSMVIMNSFGDLPKFIDGLKDLPIGN